jgi:hypothetical protein
MKENELVGIYSTHGDDEKFAVKPGSLGDLGVNGR